MSTKIKYFSRSFKVEINCCLLSLKIIIQNRKKCLKEAIIRVISVSHVFHFLYWYQRPRNVQVYSLSRYYEVYNTSLPDRKSVFWIARWMLFLSLSEKRNKTEEYYAKYFDLPRWDFCDCDRPNISFRISSSLSSYFSIPSVFHINIFKRFISPKLSFFHSFYRLVCHLFCNQNSEGRKRGQSHTVGNAFIYKNILM